MFSATLGMLAGLSIQARGQAVVDDWSTRHLIFSNPGTEGEALAKGTYSQWWKIVNDSRYIMQQRKRNHVWDGPPADPWRRSKPTVSRDWAFSLGTGGGIAQNMFPAKYTLDVTATPSCTNDFVVYGLTGTTANLVALNELYSNTGGTGFCSGKTGPSVYWAYTGTPNAGTITTSPVLSENGQDVIYVESTSSGSYLHVLVWNPNTGTLASPTTPTSVANVGACTSGESCLVSLKFGSTTDTNSSPFYDDTNDIVYVGNDAGVLYKITPVLKGTPVIAANVTVQTAGVGPHTSVLTGPVYDPNSGYVFVGDSNGVLSAVKASTFSSVTNTLAVGEASSGCSGSYNNALKDPPMVDSTHGWVYEYTTDNSSYDVEIAQASTTTATLFSTTNTVTFGSADSGCNSSNNMYTHAPDFDNTYYTGTVTSGHMWACARVSGSTSPELYYVATSGTGGGLAASGTSGIDTQINAASHGECSPITEFYNSTTSTDYVFFGEGHSGSYASFYGYTISGATGTQITPLTGYPDADFNGGTSGVVVDNNSSDTEASSIYFMLLNPATSAATCGAIGDYCAIKVTQSALGQ
jgi:hypothetical protein